MMTSACLFASSTSASLTRSDSAQTWPLEGWVGEAMHFSPPFDCICALTECLVAPCPGCVNQGIICLRKQQLSRVCAWAPPCRRSQGAAKTCLIDNREEKGFSKACKDELDAMIESRVNDFRFDARLKRT